MKGFSDCSSDGFCVAEVLSVEISLFVPAACRISDCSVDFYSGKGTPAMFVFVSGSACRWGEHFDPVFQSHMDFQLMTVS